MITSVSGSVKRSAPDAGGDQHEHHRLGPVGDARQRVEAERRKAPDHAELVSLVGVLAGCAAVGPARSPRSAAGSVGDVERLPGSVGLPQVQSALGVMDSMQNGAASGEL